MSCDKSLRKIIQSGGIVVSPQRERGRHFKRSGDKQLDGKCDGKWLRGLNPDTGEAGNTRVLDALCAFVILQCKTTNNSG